MRAGMFPRRSLGSQTWSWIDAGVTRWMAAVGAIARRNSWTSSARSNSWWSRVMTARSRPDRFLCWSVLAIPASVFCRRMVPVARGFSGSCSVRGPARSGDQPAVDLRSARPDADGMPPARPIA